MTHDELRALVPPYAAGSLSAAEAEALRAHLTDCAECVQRLFSLPVGLPRPGVERRAAVEPAGHALPIAFVALIVAFCALAGRSVYESRKQDEERRAFLGAVEDERKELTGRITALHQDLIAARAIIAQQAEALRVAEQKCAQLEQELTELKAHQRRLDPTTLPPDDGTPSERTHVRSPGAHRDSRARRYDVDYYVAADGM